MTLAHQRRPSTTSTLPSDTQQPPTSNSHRPTTLRGVYAASRRADVNQTLSYPYFFTGSGGTTSTVWGPGALTGKVLKHLGERAMGVAEHLAIRTKLSQIDKMQPKLLASGKVLSYEEMAEVYDYCEKLVELCM